jgi:uncharacterized phiE125 gp8 family phage protein
MSDSMILITAPTVEPVTLEDAKEQLSIQDELQDVNITRRIKEARQWTEEFMGRSLITQTWEMAFNTWPKEMRLRRMPVASITSIKYIDAAGVEQTVSSADYTLDTYAPFHTVRLAYNTTWPSHQDIVNAIKVRYEAGYGSVGTLVPGPIREAILLAVGHWTRYQAVAESGVSITRIPFAVENLLSPYRVINL